MQKKDTIPVNELTIYRILSDGRRIGVEMLLRDHFTLTLLAMVLATNAILLLIPVSMEYLSQSTALKFCTVMILTLLPGYAALITLLVAQLKRPTYPACAIQQLDHGQLQLSRVPYLRNAMIGIQCMLFASLLCSTFFVRQQISVLKDGGILRFTQELNMEKPFDDHRTFFPALRDVDF